MKPGQTFVAFFSGGKDSMLALHRTVSRGLRPLALITTCNAQTGRSWFHQLPSFVLEAVAGALGLPVWQVSSGGSEEYTTTLQQALRAAKAQGAELAISGDIDIAEHRAWCSEQCRAAGLEAAFPLWGEERRSLVYELIESGFTANIVVTDTRRMSDAYLGRQLTRQTVEQLAGEGVDICGEEGEYHTFVSGGPLFSRTLQVTYGPKCMEDGYAILPIESCQ